MSMTATRERVYRRSWYKRECKIDMRKRKKEYNRKIRHTKITEDSCSKRYNRMLKCLEWNTVS